VSIALEIDQNGETKNAHEPPPGLSFSSVVRVTVLVLVGSFAFAQTSVADWKDVESAMGRGGQVQPRLFFMHFWANDDAAKLARGLRAALDQTNSAK